MVPSKIAELVLEGNAEVKNFCGGIGALQTLLVPQGKQVILLNLKITTGQNFVGNNNYLHLQITTDTTKNYFAWIMADTSLSANKFLIDQDMFIKAKKDVRFMWAQSLQINVTDFSAPQPKANEEPPPSGYGETVPVVRNVSLGSTIEIYVPLTNKYDNGSLSGKVRNEVFPDIDAATTALINPGADITQTFLFNLQYVVINMPATNKY